MQRTKEINLRAGHRGRVRDRFLREGLDGFLPHEVLELLLFYAVAQKDTKIMAHSLINRFGTLSRVLHANKEELTEVEGIGAHTAAFLSELLVLARYAIKDKPLPATYDSPASVGKYFVSYYRDKKAPSLDVALFNNRLEMLQTVHLCDGELGSPRFQIKDAVEAAYSCNASSLVLASATQKPIAFPDYEDFCLFRSILKVFRDTGLTLNEIVLVSGSQYNTLLKYLKEGIWNKDTAECFWADCGYGTGEKVKSVTSPDTASVLCKMLYYGGGRKAEERGAGILERYPSLSALLSMTHDTLIETCALSSSTAVFLKLLSPLYAYTKLEEAKANTPSFADEEDLGRFFCDIHAGREEETVSLLMVDERNRLLDVKVFVGGTVNTIMVAPRVLTETAVRARAKSVAVAHNHPFGNTVPSDADVYMTSVIKRAFEQMDISFLGHFVVNEREYTLL
ncbi:MAG: hypothetical protein J6K61_00150 [Clostridia bacterium]|nr:hypothetical protein [Clostridia bacterium]